MWAVTFRKFSLAEKSLYVNKLTGPDQLPVNIFKMIADEIDVHLRNIINNYLLKSALSDSAKLALVISVFKDKREWKTMDL